MGHRTHERLLVSRATRRFTALLLVVSLASCGTGTETLTVATDPPAAEAVFPGAEWEAGTVTEDVAADLAARAATVFARGPGEGGPKAALVIKGGRIVFERYADGFDESSVMPSFSVAKSVLSVAVGVAVDRGIITLEDSGLHPSWRAGDPRSSITVEDMLHMRSGLQWDEDFTDGDPSRMLASFAGVADYAAQKELVTEPGSTFAYSTGTSAILASYLNDKLGGGTALVGFLRDNLFAPLGITSMVPLLDRSGRWVGGIGADATVRDWARFGWMVRNGGTWDGKRIVSREWLDYSRRSKELDGVYLAHWWRLSSTSLAAVGLHGQAIIVDESLDSVVVIAYGDAPDEDEGLQLGLQLLGAVALSYSD